MSVLVASYSNPSSSSSPVSPSNGSPSSSSSSTSTSSSSGLVMRKMSGLQRKRSSKTSRPSSRGGSPLSSPSHSAASASSSVSTSSGSSSNLPSSSSSSSLNGIGSPMASSAMSPSGKTMLICRHVCGCKRRGSDVTVLPSARACSSRGARHDHETNQNLHPKCNSDQPCHYLFAGQRRRASSPNNKPYCAPSPTLSNRALERMQSVSPTMLPTPTSTTRTLASITTSLDQLPLPAPIVPMQPVGTTSLSSHIGVNHSASTSSSSSPSVHVLPTFGSAFSAALAHQQQASTSTALHPTNMKRSSSDYSGQSRSNPHYHQVSSTLYSVKYEEEDDDGDDIDVVSDNHASDRYDSDEVESDSVDDSKFETNTNVSLSSISSASSVSNNHSHHSLNEAHHTHSHGDHEHSMHDDSSMNGRDDVSDSCSSEGVPMNMAPVFQFSVPSSMTYEAGLSPLEDTSFQLFEPFQNDHHSHHFMQPFSFLDQAADTQAS